MPVLRCEMKRDKNLQDDRCGKDCEALSTKNNGR